MTHLIQKVEPFKHVIWDWNGTLLNDTHHTVEAICALNKRYSVPEITVQKYKDIFRFPVKNYYVDMGYDLEKHKFEELCKEFVIEYNLKRAKHARLFEGVESVLPSIKQNKKQSILSAAEQSHLVDIVSHFDIHHHFDHIFGIDNHFAASKVERGLELMEAAKVCRSETIMIGDTDHDLEVAEKLGIQILLIADGHQSYERLKKLHDNVLETRYF